MTTNKVKLDPPAKKLRIGWFSYSCCEDSTILFTELLNDNWQEWKKILDIRHARVLQSKNILDEMDVAFIEGALTSDEHAKMVKKIRQLSKKVVAIGACAVNGMPSAQRNQFDKALNEEVQPILDRFKYLPMVKKISDVVKVDLAIPGCPMDEKKFLTAFNDLLKEFNIV
ncbi:MAG: hypothetical protein V1838_05125 [Patescibacteria group bacterium]